MFVWKCLKQKGNYNSSCINNSTAIEICLQRVKSKSDLRTWHSANTKHDRAKEHMACMEDSRRVETVKMLSEPGSYNPGQQSRLQPQLTCWQISHSFSSFMERSGRGQLKKCPSERTPSLCMQAVRTCGVYQQRWGKSRNLFAAEQTHQGSGHSHPPLTCDTLLPKKLADFWIKHTPF